MLESLGFLALATTSAGRAMAIGKADQELTRDELVAHVADLTSVLGIPLSVDSERLYPDNPGGIAATVQLLAEAGAAGCSIEDYNPASGQIEPVETAANAVAAAAEACAKVGLVLTARAENYLYGVPDLENTISRLIAYRDAGAEVLYAPGLTDSTDIAKVVSQVGAPLNVLTLPGTPPIPELAEIGVRRLSTGSMLSNAAYGMLRTGAKELIETGTSNYATR